MSAVSGPVLHFASMGTVECTCIAIGLLHLAAIPAACSAQAVHAPATGTRLAAAAAGDTGGWGVRGDEWATPAGFCTLPVLHETDHMTLSAFRRRFQSQPFVYRAHRENMTATRAQFTKPHVKDTYGQVPVLACNSEGAGPLRECETMQLRHWIDDLSDNEPNIDAAADDVQYVGWVDSWCTPYLLG